MSLNEMKATGEDSSNMEPVTGAGGAVKKRLADKKIKTGTEYPVKDLEDNGVVTPQGSNNAGLHEAIDSLFEGTDLSEDFKTKTVAIFEAAIGERVEVIREELEDEARETIAEEVSALTEKLDSYLDYVVEQWMEENAVALESNYRVQVAESLFANMKSVMEAHGISIDEDGEQAVREMEEQVEEGKARYNSLFEDFAAVRTHAKDLERRLAIATFSEGMVATDADRFATLAEGVSFDSAQELTEKLDTIKKSYFTEAAPIARDETEYLEEDTTPTAPAVDERMAAYLKALAR